MRGVQSKVQKETKKTRQRSGIGCITQFKKKMKKKKVVGMNDRGSIKGKLQQKEVGNRELTAREISE